MISAFLFRPRSFNLHRWCKHGYLNNNQPPIKPPPYQESSPNDDKDDSKDSTMFFMGSLISISLEHCAIHDKELDDTQNRSATILTVRGGNSAIRKNDKIDNILKGSKSTLQSSVLYWSDIFQSTIDVITSPFRLIQSKIQSISPSREKKREQDEEEAKVLHDLQTVIVSEVSAPNATTLPKDVLLSAAKRSGILGSTLKPDAVQECAKLLKQWYVKQGFVLNAMTGATLVPEKNQAVLSIQEPIVSNIPVDITFAKELVLDPETDQPMTYREYRQYHHRRKTHKDNILSRENMNTTIVETAGRTRPYVLANVLKLQPGKNFCWNQNRWDHIKSSGIFSRVLRATPERMRDGSIQLHIIAQEAPPRNLEYGVSRSLYTGSWEGELDFLHGNILGGGETLGLTVRRGAKDSEPSIRLRFQDDNFGLEGGYHIELFNDYVAVDVLESTDSASNKVDQDADDRHSSTKSMNSKRKQENIASLPHDDGALISRKGATIRWRDPKIVPFVHRSSVSTSLERTSARTGKHEEIGSVTLELGPFKRSLPYQARANVVTSYTVGSRLYEDELNTWHRDILPYSSAVATTRQIIPLLSYDEDEDEHKQVQLAFQHSIMASTHHLPRHEANAAGIAARVRGYSLFANGPIGRYVAGTAELRVPVNVPFTKVNQDANIVFFGDWMYGERRLMTSNTADIFVRKASVGVGLRKTVQGLPLKYDICLTEDRKIGGFFSLGRDFDV